jgi:uncharacterized membrane protein YoaK (UPF0700 family)
VPYSWVAPVATRILSIGFGDADTLICTRVALTEVPMRISVPALLTLNGGYTDTAGFLVLQGLFTAHVTGNFSTLGASLVHGTSGAAAKILALPVFCVVIFLVRYFSNSVAFKGGSAINTLVAVKASLFTLAAALAVIYGPFADGDALTAIVTGMALVAGMAIQNAAHRIFFEKSPPGTVMTGTTSQLMMDLSDLAQADVPAELRALARIRCAALLKTVGIFVFGCAVAALMYARFDRLALLVPPLISITAFRPRFR